MLKQDPAQRVRAHLGDLVVEVRTLPQTTGGRTAAQAFASIGPWAGETTAEVLQLLAEARRGGGQERVPGL